MFNATFNIVSVISQKPLTYLYISWVSPEKMQLLSVLSKDLMIQQHLS